MPNITDKPVNSDVNKKFKKFNNKFPNWTKLSKDKQKSLLNAFCILYFYKKQNTFFKKFCRGFRKGSYSFADTFLISESQIIIITLQNELFDIAFKPTNPQDVNDLIAEVAEKIRLEKIKEENDYEYHKKLSERIEALRG